MKRVCVRLSHSSNQHEHKEWQHSRVYEKQMKPQVVLIFIYTSFQLSQKIQLVYLTSLKICHHLALV